jgi:lipid-A-disaccharide synthase
MLVSEQVRDARFLVPLASRETRALFEEALYRAGATELPIKLLFGHAREAMACADAVLVASGTASLEAALIGRPMVITYRMSPTTWRLMSRMRYQPWVGLPNIIAGEFLVPEILQEEATPENLAQALVNVSQDPAVLERLPQQFARMHGMLRRDASRRAAEAVLQCLKPASSAA